MEASMWSKASCSMGGMPDGRPTSAPPAPFLGPESGWTHGWAHGWWTLLVWTRDGYFGADSWFGPMVVV